MNSASSNLEISRSLQPAGPPFKHTCLPCLLLPLLPDSALSHPRLAGGDDWAAVAAALRPGLLRPLSRDEHHQVRPLSGLPFLMCATEHPNPSLLFVFGSDLLTSVYACIMPTNFDCCAKIIGCTCLHPMSLPGVSSCPS